MDGPNSMTSHNASIQPQDEVAMMEWRPSPLAKGILYRKALRTVSDRSGGLVPIAFGADSVASALHLRCGRDPAADVVRVAWASEAPDRKRKFLLCTKPEVSTLR